MTNSCCNLVGNFNVNPDLGLISVTSQGSTDVSIITAGGSSAAIIGPSTGSISLTAYAGTKAYIGCPGRAGVSVNWIVKNDCAEPIYLWGGAGRSYISGKVGSYASFPSIEGLTNPVSTYNVISASASSGPAALYEDSDQQDGFGLIYTGKPWRINTSTEAGCTFNLTSYGIGTKWDNCKLQNLNIQCVPGQVPVVNMSFVYIIERTG